MQEIFNRSKLLLGSDAMQRLATMRVILFGVGGVGSWCAEALVRTGLQHLTIVDCDDVSVTNVNRQLQATTKTVGRVKVEVMKERLLEINPEAQITTLNEMYSAETCEMFHLEDYDYIIDCIDSLKDKMSLLHEATKQERATVLSSMGAALKVDPTQIRVAEFWKVRGCPLGSIMRKRMRQRNITLSKPVMCVYSEELQENKGSNEVTQENCSYKVQINGSLAHITGIYGFTLAGLIIKDLYKS